MEVEASPGTEPVLASRWGRIPLPTTERLELLAFDLRFAGLAQEGGKPSLPRGRRSRRDVLHGGCSGRGAWSFSTCRRASTRLFSLPLPFLRVLRPVVEWRASCSHWRGRSSHTRAIQMFSNLVVISLNFVAGELTHPTPEAVLGRLPSRDQACLKRVVRGSLVCGGATLGRRASLAADQALPRKWGCKI